MNDRTLRIVAGIILLFVLQPVQAQERGKAIISYYSGNAERLDSFDANKMTHIIYCFGHLDGNRLKIGRAKDTLTIHKMVAMKKRNPSLKVLVSLGGWGGCKTCSDVFNTSVGRKEFAQSVKEINSFFGADGIDLDWEYPVVEGYPGHVYRPEDKDNFTALVQELRKTLGSKQVITFAAGGFQQYLEQAIDWQKVVPLVDYINLMTYDLVGGYSPTTGHHTPLYSSANQKQSTDNCVQYLKRIGVDASKLIIGAAFYARVWENVANVNNGLYQPGKFKNSPAFKDFPQKLSEKNGYTFYWDDSTSAPYAYNRDEKLFATFDNKRSIALKTKYMMDQKLGGIMYWELGLDTYKDGLLDTIHETLKQ